MGAGVSLKGAISGDDCEGFVVCGWSVGDGRADDSSFSFAGGSASSVTLFHKLAPEGPTRLPDRRGKLPTMVSIPDIGMGGVAGGVGKDGTRSTRGGGAGKPGAPGASDALRGEDGATGTSDAIVGEAVVTAGNDLTTALPAPSCKLPGEPEMSLDEDGGSGDGALAMDW